jgi:hypothetical protein
VLIWGYFCYLETVCTKGTECYSSRTKYGSCSPKEGTSCACLVVKCMVLQSLDTSYPFDFQSVVKTKARLVHLKPFIKHKEPMVSTDLIQYVYCCHKLASKEAKSTTSSTPRPPTEYTTLSRSLMTAKDGFSIRSCCVAVLPTVTVAELAG